MKRAIAVGLLLTFSVGAAAQMALPGSFEVSETGAAVYTIPIAVPPGTAGLEPKLTLQYNSRAGNGLLGVGWTLGGLPSIVRCPKTVAQDGARGGVNYDANDRFCLEGERLVAITGTYGADGTEYRTEREGFSKIVSYGTAGTGPAWFKVWTKAGQILEFGNTADSRIEAQGKTTARLWTVNKVGDTAGNYFTVTYAEDSADGEYRPTRIDYIGNAAAGAAPYASVRFVYEGRPTTDQTPLYEAGSLIKTTQRLTKLQTYTGEVLVRDYRLAYDQGASTKRSRLSSVELCGTDNSCLPGLSVVSGDPSQGFAIQDRASSLNGGVQWNWRGDFNGDGRMDIASWVDGAGGTLVRGHLSTENGFTIQDWASSLNGSAQWNWLGDFNGDGRADFASWVDNGGGLVRVHLSTGSGFTLQDWAVSLNGSAQWNWSGDFNGDGRTDFASWVDGAGGTLVRLQATSGSSPDLATSFTNGSGLSTNVSSVQLSQGGTLYTKDAGSLACAYPCVDMQGPLYVVSEVQSANGIGGTYRTTYKYAGAKADQAGRGFLGFRQVIAKDEQTLVEQASEYLQSWPFVGLTAKRTKTLGAVELNRTENTYASDDLGSGRKFVKLTQSVESSREITGTALPTVTASYQYDAYGNATNVAVSTGDGHSKTTVNTYTNDLTNWLLGRLTRAEVTSVTP